MHIYMATDKTGAKFNYRGVATSADDPQAFKRVMAARGFEVLIRDDCLPGEGWNINRSAFPELGPLN